MRTTRGNLIPQPVEEDLLARALSKAADPIFITDYSGYIVWVNEAFSERSGFPSQEVIGKTPGFLKSGRHEASFYRELWSTIIAGQIWRGDVVERRKDGLLYTVDEVITPLLDDNGIATHFLVIQRDVTLRNKETERERFLAYHDPLTGLYNRVLFVELLRQAVSRSGSSGKQFALLFLDLDNFKLINDTFGHHTGDQLLVAVAERLSAAVRKTTDAIARLGRGATA